MMLSVFTESSFPLLPNEKDGDKTPKPPVVVVMKRVCDRVQTRCKIKRREKPECVSMCARLQMFVCFGGLN